MRYWKCLFYNFLTVFFANHILPGIAVTDPTRLPHIGGDLLFAFALGILNTLVIPGLRLFKKESILHMAVGSLILNFLVFALVKVLPVGISVLSIEGYLLAALLVSIVTFLVNYWELKASHKTQEPPSSFPPASKNEPRPFQ
jgi:uncharacterized membrane protein YvlD (DUF360 family)